MPRLPCASGGFDPRPREGATLKIPRAGGWMACFDPRPREGATPYILTLIGKREIYFGVRTAAQCRAAWAIAPASNAFV